MKPLSKGDTCKARLHTGDENNWQTARFVGNPCVLVPAGVSV